MAKRTYADPSTNQCPLCSEQSEAYHRFTCRVVVQREQLKDAVVEAAMTWANNDKGFTRIALRHAMFQLWEFERNHATATTGEGG